MQLAIAQASRSVAADATGPQDALNTLLSKLLHPRITSEEAAFVADLARDVNGMVAKKV